MSALVNSKKTVRVRFVNGLTFAAVEREILAPLAREFRFVHSESPDCVIVGPCGGDIPLPDAAARVGYFCQNIRPDRSICDWVFGIPHEVEVETARCMRLEGLGVEPDQLVRRTDPTSTEQRSR